MEEVKTWISAELAKAFDETELKEIEGHARELAEADGETWSAFHHRGSIPIEYKLDDGPIEIGIESKRGDDGILYIF